MTEINPAAIDLPPTQPIDMTALMDQIRLGSELRTRHVVPADDTTTADW